MDKKRTVLLTGAARGIGMAIYETLNDSGRYNIIAPTRGQMDLNDRASVDAYMSNCPKIDILINNAGINILEAIEDIDSESLKSMLTVNLEAPLMLIKYATGHMKTQKYGRIVNMSSVWSIRSKEYRTLYSMTKFGLNGITKSLARELGRYGILINSVCPGYVNTELTKQNVPVDEQEKIKKDIPLGRFGEPYEIAKFVEFLVSEGNTYITGQTLVIDGGFLA